MAQLEIEVFSNPLVALYPHVPMWDIENYSSLVDYDIELLKPALLFADRVNLRTFRNTMRDMVYSKGVTLYIMPMWRLSHFVAIVKRANAREIGDLGLRPQELPTPDEAQAGWEAIGRGENDFWMKYEEVIDRAAHNARAIWTQRSRDLDAQELDRATSSGLLTVEGWLPALPRDHRALAIDTEEMFDVSMDVFIEMLNMIERQPMLDAGASWIANNWTGPHRPSIESWQGTKDWHASTMVGANAIMRLPGLDKLSLIDVLDLRDGLSEYLPAFRSEMVRLGEDIAADEKVAAREITAEVDRRWHKDIAPVLTEIRQQVAAAAYPRRLLNAVTSEKDVLATIGGAVVLAAGSVAAGLSTLIPAAAAAAYPFAKALNESLGARDEAKKNRLYFLYALQDGIRQRLSQ